jgi:protocatechuate 3,4-dioxygenase beta subunit
LRLPAGLHRLLADHPRRVSSAELLLRVGSPMEVELPLEAGLVVVGQVLDGAGGPVGGARVSVFADGFPTGRADLTGPDGSFGVTGFRGDVISLAVSARGYATTLERVRYFPGEERARTAVILRPGSAALVEVRDAGGRALLDAGAVLLPGWYESALAEPRLGANHTPERRRGGHRFRFEGLEPGRRYRILVEAPGHLPESTTTFVAPRAGTVLPVSTPPLRRGAAIEGRAQGTRGLVVVCTGPEGRMECRTDRAGRYRFEGLDAGEHLLFVRDVDERRVPVPLLLGETTRMDLAVRPAPERAVEGTVLDADGRPLAGVEVSAGPRTVTTDDQGAFAIVGCPPGRLQGTLGFRPGPGSSGLLADPHLPHVEDGVGPGERLRVQLRRAGVLWLRLDTRGRNLTRATLHLAGTSGWAYRRRLPRRATEIRIPDIAVGSYEVEVSAPGFVGTNRAVVTVTPAAPAEPVPVPVVRGRSVAGRVVLRRTVRRAGMPPEVTDEPVARGWVRLLDPDPRRSMATTPVDEDGSYRLEGLPAGPVVLAAAAPGYPAAVVRTDLTTADREDLLLPLREGAEAAVVVTDREGRALPQAQVRILHEVGIDVRDVAAVGRFGRVVAGVADFAEIVRSFSLERRPTGRIAAPFLAPGSYRFFIEAPGYSPVRIGVRARPSAVLEEIRAIPGSPRDLATPVRLNPAPRGAGSAPNPKD